MGRLLDALLELDGVARTGARALGERSRLGRQLLEEVTRLRRILAPAALHQAAEGSFDPRADMRRIFRAAEDAGLSWPDLAEALNTYRETRGR